MDQHATFVIVEHVDELRPDEPGPTDLGESGQHEQQDRTDRHDIDGIAP